MNPPLADDELVHLLEFVGYGSLAAPVWFVGMEEAGGGEDNLRRRLSFSRVMDLAEAHRILGIIRHHWGPRAIQPTWAGMCRIMLGLSGLADDVRAVREYQAAHLGRHGGQTLLAELMPIPKTSYGEWGYEGLIPQFRSRDHYYDSIKPTRIRHLESLVVQYKPRVLICYGKTFWDDFLQLLPGATVQPSGTYLSAYLPGTLMVLTHHLAARSMNGRFGEIVGLIHNFKRPSSVHAP